ncbi:MAG: hypothetical protein AAFW01_02205 [Pseudomonadota bacterium]
MDLLVILALAMASQEAGPAPGQPAVKAEPPPGSSRLVACLATRSARCGCPEDRVVLGTGARLDCGLRRSPELLGETALAGR